MEKLGTKLFTVAMPDDPEILEQIKRNAAELKAMFNRDGDDDSDEDSKPVEDPNEEIEKRKMKNRKRKLKKKRSKDRNKRTKLCEEFEKNSERKITNHDS